MHLHVRQGKRLAVVGHTARQFKRAIVEPNTTPYVTTVGQAAQYREEILAALPDGSDFQPFMALYLQTTTSPETIRAAKKSGIVGCFKMYPAGVTTNSAGGVKKIQDVEEQLHVMEEVDIPLQIHGESAGKDDDVFQRESIFYREAFPWIISTFPGLRVSCEHITTRAAVEMIEGAPKDRRIGATITAQHLLVDWNYLLGAGLRPHAYCKPILKGKKDRCAVLGAATSGNPRFFLGTDSAPHPQNGEAGKAKECDCGCAGCFTAHAALELYAEAFESAGKIERLDDFASLFGAQFYGLSRNEGTVELVQEEWHAQASYDFGEGQVVPFRQELPLQWRML